MQRPAPRPTGSEAACARVPRNPSPAARHEQRSPPALAPHFTLHSAHCTARPRPPRYASPRARSHARARTRRHTPPRAAAARRQRATSLRRSVRGSSPAASNSACPTRCSLSRRWGSIRGRGRGRGRAGRQARAATGRWSDDLTSCGAPQRAPPQRRGPAGTAGMAPKATAQEWLQGRDLAGVVGEQLEVGAGARAEEDAVRPRGHPRLCREGRDVSA